MGGLDPQAPIEHALAGFADGILAGKPIRDWSRDNLAAYFDRYNIGWVVCFAPESAAWLRDQWGAHEEATFLLDRPGWLFRLVRHPSFTLKGKPGGCTPIRNASSSPTWFRMVVRCF